MEFDFTKAGIAPLTEGCYLLIEAPFDTCSEFLGQMQDGKTYVAKLTEKKQKRSLDANARYWELCGRLARKLGCTPEEVYRQHIRDIGNYDTLCMVTEAVPAFAARWVSDHTGRQISTRASKIPGCTTVLAYYGSSDFDRAQMSKLIDNCIQDCLANDVETRTKEEVESLLAQWK